MVSRAQFLGASAVGVLATAFHSSSSAYAQAPSRFYRADEQGIASDSSEPVNHRINELIDQLAQSGGGSILFPPGRYPVDSSGIVLKHQVSIMGVGDSTQFMPVGDWEELAGVFRIGEDTVPSKEPVYRTGLHQFSIKPGEDPYKHRQAIPNTVGILYNTFNGDNPPDPDAAHRISGITLWDLDMGIKLKGPDDQGCTVSQIRGRRFLRTALTVGDTNSPTAADNMFHMLDFSSANLQHLDAAAIEVYTSNCSFSQVKSWYSKRSMSFDESVKAGAGYYIKGTRNSFNQCDAQDNGGHGFVLSLGNNSLMNCIADSNGYAENISGEAQTSEAHGFHVERNATGTQLIGCQSFNRTRNDPGQSVGFWAHEGNTQVTIIGSAFANTTRASQTGALETAQKTLIDPTTR
ncbi:hypothetical protein ACN083_05245 [Rothia sp. CCM 9418]|uniref:hypothetical protein n=1 Tax=Rothia sp. CCM 9418 TaxID=3402661 RepID=UPI003ADDD199